ncbi:MAG: FkbM family methyltransferase [Alphaproteobacteria bacterium]|nr:FkbM family methyltransferase [Alphaproteobacteria bacterium]
MIYKIGHTASRHLVRNLTFYNFLRRLMLIRMKLFRSLVEEDFVVFSAAPKNQGLILDIGANGGQSAVAFSFLCPTHRIISFEPNPTLAGELKFAAKLIGDRFSFHQVGLSSQEDTLTLYVPKIGKLPIEARASLDKGAATRELESLSETYRGAPEVQETQVHVRRLDDFGFLPDIIKIDVESMEHRVLEGALSTIEISHPLMLLEKGLSEARCKALLRELGYEFYEFDGAGRGTLKSADVDGAINYFAIPQGWKNALRAYLT